MIIALVVFVCRERKTIVITGSSGFIGRALCSALAADGYTVVGFDRPGGSRPPPGVNYVPCDVTSEDSVEDAVGHLARELTSPLASVIHLAAYYDFSGEPSPLYGDVTVNGTERLLRVLKKVQPPEQFIFSSTMLAHAPCDPGEHISEGSPLNPKWAYPASKLETELVIRAERKGIPAVLLRIAGVYSDRCESIPLANQIQRIYEHRLTSRVFPGDISHGQSFVHLNDLVEAFSATVERRAALARYVAILIGEPEPLSYDELQRTFAALIDGNRDWETTEIPKAVAKAGAWVQDKIPGIEEPFIKPWMIDLADDHYALDISRAQRLLDWSPTRRLRKTLPSMVAALKKDPAAFYAVNQLQGAPPYSRTGP